MVDVFDRHFVRYSDYAALEAQLADTQVKLDAVLLWVADHYPDAKDRMEKNFKFKLGLSALKLPDAPKVTEAMVETEMVRMTISETIRAMGANPDEQLIGELTVFDAVAAKVRAALAAAQEAGKP